MHPDAFALLRNVITHHHCAKGAVQITVVAIADGVRYTSGLSLINDQSSQSGEKRPMEIAELSTEQHALLPPVILSNPQSPDAQFHYGGVSTSPAAPSPAKHRMMQTLSPLPQPPPPLDSNSVAFEMQLDEEGAFDFWHLLQRKHDEEELGYRALPCALAALVLSSWCGMFGQALSTATTLNLLDCCGLGFRHALARRLRAVALLELAVPSL